MEICHFKDIDDVIPMQPEIQRPPLKMRRYGKVNWLFNVTINDISVIYVTAQSCAGGLKKKMKIRSDSFINLAIGPKCQGDLQGHMIFYITAKSHGYPRSLFFFSPPAHLCAVTYMTEISLIVTLNNQFNSTLIKL